MRNMDDQAAEGHDDARVSEPARADPIAGELVTETFGYDGGRQVTVYVPPDPPQAVVFAGDGQLISQWGGYLEAADVPPTMIVGVYRTDAEDEMARIREYSPEFDPDIFAAHESFFVDDVGGWVRSRFGVALPAERTAVCGVSASGELALADGAPALRTSTERCSVPRRGAVTALRRRCASLPTSHVPRGRHPRAVVPRERDPMGGRAPRCWSGRGDDGTGRRSRGSVLGGRIPADGGVGVQTLTRRVVTVGARTEIGEARRWRLSAS